MKHRIRIFIAFAVVLAALVGASVGASSLQQPRDHSKEQPDPAAMMHAWAEKMKPGEAEEELKRFVGTWDCTMKVYMQGPTAPPTESKGISVQKLVLGGRFLLQEYSGTMLGMPYNGQGLMGYDHSRKLFVSTWADSMSGSISYMTGGKSADGNTYTSFGTIDEAWSGEIGKTIKYVLRIVDKDTIVFTSWQVLHAEDAKAFEIEYRRAK